MPACQEAKLQYLEAKGPPPADTMRGDVWEAGAFVWEKSSMPSVSSRGSGLETLGTRKVACGPDKSAYLRFPHLPPHPHCPRKGMAWEGRRAHTRTHTLTLSRPQTHLFSPKHALHIEETAWLRADVPSPRIKHTVRSSLEKPLPQLWSPTLPVRPWGWSLMILRLR